MRRRALAPLTLVLATGVILFAGCDGATNPVREVRVAASILDVEVPDTVGVGEVAVLVATLGVGGCKSTLPVIALRDGPRRIVVHLQITDLLNTTCTADVRSAPVATQVRLPEPGTWTIDFIGLNTMSASIVAVGD